MKEQFIMSNNRRRPVSSIFKKIDGTLEQQNKAHQILTILLARKMYEKSIKTLYEERSSKTFVKSFH